MQFLKFPNIIFSYCKDANLLCKEATMYEWIYEELDPNLNWKIYYTKKRVLNSFDVGTIMPENGLSAESLLNHNQIKKTL